MTTKAIVTLADGDFYKSILAETIEPMSDYAKRIGADLIIYKNDIEYKVPHYKKLDAIKDTLLGYDRVLWLDADVLISKKAPNIFDAVPEGELGIFNEGRWVDRTKAREEWKFITGETIPGDEYYNTGVIAAEKIHLPLFTQPEIPIIHFGEQTFLNRRIQEWKFKVHSLAHHWNRMGCTHMQLGEEPFISHFIHFAGEAQANGNLPNFIKETVQSWKSQDWSGEKTIVINTTNGMGNQIALLPSVKFMIEMYPDYLFLIRTAFPEVYEPLKSKQVAVAGADAVVKSKFALHKGTSITGIVHDSLSHPTDFHSMSLLQRQLPVNKRRIMVPIRPCGKTLPPWTIALHAGRSGWRSKEMPIEMWQEISDGLRDVGFKIALIGTEVMGAKPQWGCFKIKNVDFDFVGVEYAKTCDVLSQSWMSLQNDTMTAHAAGAFDKWIGLITIAKRPEHILPYRDESNTHKTIAWTGKPFWEVVPEIAFHNPNAESTMDQMYPGMEWPSPEKIITDIKNIAVGEGFAPHK